MLRLNRLRAVSEEQAGSCVYGVMDSLQALLSWPAYEEPTTQRCDTSIMSAAASQEVQVAVPLGVSLDRFCMPTASTIKQTHR